MVFTTIPVCSGEMKLMELDRVCGRVGLIVFGIGTQENGAEAMWVVVGGVIIPSGTELGITNRH